MLNTSQKRIGERIRIARDRAGVTNARIAESCDVSPQAVGGWIRTGKISAQKLAAVARVLGTTSDWLLSSGYEVRNATDVTYMLNDMARPINTRVPLISWVQAGHWADAVDNFEPGDAEEWIAVDFSTSDNTFALRVNGDSMEPEFVMGSTIIVDPRSAPHNGAYVVARLNSENEATFKQLVMDGDRLYLKPLNPRYPIIEVNEDMTISGVVRAQTKRY